MGYDMHSKKVAGDEGYFRLNIWGMGWMRNIMFQAGIKSESLMKKFCSNDGWLVSAAEGKRISDALNKFLKTHPLGSKTLVNKMATKKEEIPEDAVSVQEYEMGNLGSCFDYQVEVPLNEDDIQTIKEWAEYNATKAPYQVF